MPNVIPLLRALLRYSLPTDRGFKRTSTLMINPKRELLGTVREVLTSQAEPDRLTIIDSNQHTKPVKFFTDDECISNREKLEKIDLILDTARHADGNHSYWHVSGMQVLEKFMNLEVAYRIAKASILREPLHNSGETVVVRSEDDKSRLFGADSSTVSDKNNIIYCPDFSHHM